MTIQRSEDLTPLSDIAQCQMSRASTLRELGKLEEAVSGYDAALPFLRRLDALEKSIIDTEEEDVRAILQRQARMASAYCLQNRAIALNALGRPAEALEDFERLGSFLD